jgi:hypothetical protein
MKTDWTHLEAARSRDGAMSSREGDLFGAFYVRVGTVDLIIIATTGCDEIPWEHVSLRARDYKGERVPTWSEMCRVKDLFWEAEECVVQYHPPKSDYINNHPFVLHLWKPLNVEMPRPPKIAVGI